VRLRRRARRPRPERAPLRVRHARGRRGLHRARGPRAPARDRHRDRAPQAHGALAAPPRRREGAGLGRPLPDRGGAPVADRHARASRSARGGRRAPSTRSHLRQPARSRPPLAALLQYAGRDGPRARAPRPAAVRRGGRLNIAEGAAPAQATIAPPRGGRVHPWRILFWSLLIALLAFADFAGRASGRITSLPADAFYRYGTAVAAIVGDGFLLLIVVLIGARLPLRRALALRPPASWRDATVVGAGVLPFGAAAAVVLTALAFALAHGAVVDFPVLLATGLGLGYLRYRAGSLYPCIALHGVFNGVGLLAAALAGAT